MPQQDFRLPDSPWTYENGSYNPNLAPSGSVRRRTGAGRADVPPYHPDYEEPLDGEYGAAGYDSAEEEEDDDAMERWAQTDLPRVRRGSEGYEIRPMDREEILARYVASRGAEAGRYNRYVPEPPSEPETESEEDEEQPLADKVQMWRQRADTDKAK